METIGLRQKLEEITELAPIAEQPARIAALQAEHHHSIVVVDSSNPIERYTCAVFAFYLVEDPTYLNIASAGLGRTFAGAEFINFLLRNHLLSPRESGALPNDLVLYFEQGIFRHVGRVKGKDRIVSKWGRGWLWEHGIWEIPQSYGDSVRYFIGPDEVVSLDLFMRFAESRGFRFD